MRLTRTGERWRVTEVTSIGASDETMVGNEGEQRQGDGAPLPNPSPSSAD
jgi:Mce-associated membrane protein